MKRTELRFMSVVLVCVMLLGMLPVMQTTADAASIVNLNDSSVFLKQGWNTNTCTFVSALMMFRRGALINKNSNWDSFTENNYRNSWWGSGSLAWTLHGEGMQAGTYLIENGDTYNIPRGELGVRKTWFIDKLTAHPEGIVLYFWTSISAPQHAVLLTKYDSAKSVCAALPSELESICPIWPPTIAVRIELDDSPPSEPPLSEIPPLRMSS